MSSPTSRSLQYLRDQGYQLVQVVEHWNSFCHIRQDLFHFIDVLAIKGGKTYGFQVTSGSNVSARIKKITVENADTLFLLKDAGWEIWVHGWAKKSKVRGGKQKIWTLREVQL